ncbi:MAG: methyltransferase [Sphingomonas sp.]
MRQPLLVPAFVAAAAAALVAAAPYQADPGLSAAVAAPTRTPANTVRDKYRHPAETLAFFGVRPTDTIVEIWPAGGWYTEILAPFTSGKGTLYAVDFWPDALGGVRKLQEKDPALYGAVKLAAFPWSEGQPRVADGTADVVLTFRNIHNFRMGYKRDGKEYAAEAFAQMFAMLKAGGTLGVVDHRLPEDASDEREKSSGYIKVSTVRRLAEAAGFRFAGASEVNANPRDSADWEKGVWTLPPRLALGDTDREKYLAIGESDRMTLKFRKP